MKEYFKQFFCDTDVKYSFIIEADGKVCYAYLLHNNKIVGDVWIGNQVAQNDEHDFSDPSLMPFLNPKEYLFTSHELIKEFEPISISWDISFNHKRVTICFSDNIIVRLEEGVYPGWSNRVIKNGPLAKTIDS